MNAICEWNDVFVKIRTKKNNVEYKLIKYNLVVVDDDDDDDDDKNDIFNWM